MIAAASMKIIAFFIAAFCLEGIVFACIFYPLPSALLALSVATLLLVATSELTKQRMLLEKHERMSMTFLGLWVLLSIYYTVMGLSLLIYLSEYQLNEVGFSNRLIAFMVSSRKLTFGEIAWINLTFYFGNALCLGFYARSFYRMFWMESVVHIYRYLKKKVKMLNETLVSSLPTIPLSSELEGSICSLCLEEYNQFEEITKLPCSHIYHRNCVRIWVMRSNACPLCRRRVIYN